MKKSKIVPGFSALLVALVGVGGSVAPAYSQAVHPSNTIRAAMPSAAPSISEPRRMGMDIFEALFFGSGPKAESMVRVLGDPAYDNYVKTANKSAESIQAISVILGQMEVDKPNFFQDFYMQISSGDPIVVHDALANAGTELRDVLTKKSGSVSDPAEIKAAQDKAGPMAAVPVFLVVAAVVDAAAAINYAVVLNVGAVVNVAAAVKAKVKLWPGSEVGGASQFRDEEVSATLAGALAR